MQRLSLILLTLWLVQAHAAQPVVLVFGDSLSAGYGLNPSQSWVALLKKKLRRQAYAYRVVNASLSGETTIGGRARLPALLKKYQPQVVILELGANDGLRGLPLSSVKSNLAHMIVATKNQSAKLLLVGMRLPPNYGKHYTREFELMYRQLAEENNITLLPFLMAGFAKDLQLMQADGVHPNKLAQPYILKNVWPYLVPLLKK